MKRKLYFILAAICLLLVITACQSGADSDPTPEPEVTEPEAPASPQEPEEEPTAEPEIDHSPSLVMTLTPYPTG